MARGINKTIIIGHLGDTPEVKSFPDGGRVANASVATTISWTDRQTGEKREQTEWHRVVFNNGLADVAAQYLRKGSQVYIEGSLRTRKWQDQNGQDRYTTEIKVKEMQMLNKKPETSIQGGLEQQQESDESRELLLDEDSCGSVPF